MKLFIQVNQLKLIFFLVAANIILYILIHQKFKDAMTEIDVLQRKFLKLRLSANFRAPTLIYEKNRRRIRSTLQLMCSFIKHQVKEIKKDKTNLEKNLTFLLEEIYNHKISILSDWKLMSLNDGYEKWRQKEFKNVNKLIQKRFQNAMNPKNCATANVFLCNQWHPCGWGCLVFHYIQSFSHAFGTKRFLSFVRLPPISNWYGADMFTKYYEPYSQSCNQTMYQHEYQKWADTNNSKVLVCPGDFRKYKEYRKYTYQAVPKDLVPRLEKITDISAIWYISQIEEFLLKLKPKYKKYMKDVAEKIGFKHPIVGVHVRRTDKKYEAPNQPLSEYMEKVKEYYDTLELTQKVDKKRVFLATDELSVIEEAITKYSDKYEILVIKNHTQEAENIVTRSRYTLGIMTDVNLLAKCDHFVGTLSSNVGRRVLEFMFRTNLYASEQVSPMESKYFEVIGVAVPYRVLIKNKSTKKEELNVDVGDIIYSTFKNRKFYTSITEANFKEHMGLISRYKIEEFPRAVDFPKYGVEG